MHCKTNEVEIGEDLSEKLRMEEQALELRKTAPVIDAIVGRVSHMIRFALC